MRQARLELQDIATKRGAFTLKVDTLRIPRGKIACVVGPNGGGKTSLLLTALGLLPHAGQCVIDGQQYDGAQTAIKAHIGFIPDDPELLFEELTAREQWQVAASVLAQATGQPQASYMARAQSLADALTFKPPATIARTYSHGMRKKTQIVQALMGQPSVVIIDELRNGLDPIAIKQAEELIKDERKRGAAILAATHDLWWAERFADHIYILDQGNIIAHGTLKQLLRKREAHLEQAFFRLIGASA